MTMKATPLFRRDAFTTGGGLIDDFDGTITKARYGKTTYGGAADHPVTVGLITFQPDDPEIEAHEELFSIGSKLEKLMTPSKDGRYLVPKPPNTEAVGMSEKAKLAMLVISAMDAGWEPAQGSDENDITNLEGIHAHFKRKQLPKIEGGTLRRKAKDFPDTVLLVSELLDEKPVAKAAARAAAPARGAVPKAASNGNGFDGDLADVIQAAIEEKGDALPLSDVRRAVFKARKGQNDAQDWVKRANDKDFYEQDPRFEFDGESVGLT